MLRAGVYRVDITPPVGITYPRYSTQFPNGFHAAGVHDPLWAKALVLDDGRTQCAILTLDQCIPRRDFLQAIRERVARETTIAPENVFIASTHTHSGRELRYAYGEPEHPFEIVAREKAAGAVVMASRNLTEVTVSCGRGRVPQGIVYNRRKRLPGGTLTMTCPETDFDLAITRYYRALGLERDQVEGIPADPRPLDGPVDDELILLHFQDAAGKTVASFMNFACHPVILSLHDAHLSGDWVAVAAGIVERETGAPCLFTQGAAADVRPYYRRTKDYGEVVRVGRAIGGTALQALAALQEVSLTREPVLATACQVLKMPLRDFVDVPEKTARLLDEAKRRWEQRDGMSLVERRKAWERLKTVERYHQWSVLRVTPEELEGRYFLEEVYALRIGEAGIVGLPGEFFTQFGLQIKAAAPFPVTIPVTITNPGFNYHPPEAEYEEGGHELTACMLEPGSSERIVAAALELAARTAK